MQPMTAATTTMDSVQPSFLLRLQASLFRQWQTMLDNSVPHTIARWIFLFAVVVAYMVRVYYLQGFYIVTYGLGIFLLNLFIGFLSPLDDVEGDGPLLPTGSSDEFKPFIRRLPEFKFWLSCVKAMFVGFTMTFFSFFNVPVFWPILLVYFILLFALTMKKQISHMIKHKYLPFNLGKKTYGKEAKASALPGTFALGAENSSRND